MGLEKKAAYLKGLIEGLGIDEETKEGKIIRAMSDVLQEMAAEIDSMGRDLEDLNDDMDDLDEFLQKTLFDDEEEDEDEDDADEPCYEVECPNCGETVYVTEADLEEKEAFCTSCGKSFGIELAEEADEDSAADAGKYEVTCPKCGAVTVVDEDTLLNGEVRCASCGAVAGLEADGEE